MTQRYNTTCIAVGHLVTLDHHADSDPIRCREPTCNHCILCWHKLYLPDFTVKATTYVESDCLRWLEKLRSNAARQL